METIIETIIDHVIENEMFGANDEHWQYVRDIYRHGCASGLATDMITYQQTHQFFDDNYDEIEEYRREMEIEIVVPHDEDLKNYLAWAAYEYGCAYLIDEAMSAGEWLDWVDMVADSESTDKDGMPVTGIETFTNDAIRLFLGRHKRLPPENVMELTTEMFQDRKEEDN